MLVVKGLLKSKLMDVFNSPTAAEFHTGSILPVFLCIPQQAHREGGGHGDAFHRGPASLEGPIGLVGGEPQLY